MQPKEMENLVTFNSKEGKIAATEEREKEEYSSAEGQ